MIWLQKNAATKSCNKKKEEKRSGSFPLLFLDLHNADHDQRTPLRALVEHALQRIADLVRFRGLADGLGGLRCLEAVQIVVELLRALVLDRAGFALEEETDRLQYRRAQELAGDLR